MNKYILIIIVIIILLLFGLMTFSWKKERYISPSKELTDDVILKILGTRLNQEQLFSIVSKIYNENDLHPYYKYYLKEIIGYLKSPNFNKFMNIFLDEVERILNFKIDEGETNLFNQENLNTFLNEIILQENQANQPIGFGPWGEQIGWQPNFQADDLDDLDEVNLNQPQDAVIPQPFWPPQEEEIFDPWPANAFD